MQPGRQFTARHRHQVDGRHKRQPGHFGDLTDRAERLDPLKIVALFGEPPFGGRRIDFEFLKRPHRACSCLPGRPEAASTGASKTAADRLSSAVATADDRPT